jgi:two-component system nitrate/nitrite response regulator NarL
MLSCSVLTTVCELTDRIYKIARIENEGGVVEKGKRMSDVASHTLSVGPLNSLHHLTPRQLQIASLASQGFSNKEVGRQLNVSEGTVKLHLHSIYTRLGLRNRTELASIVLSSR